MLKRYIWWARFCPGVYTEVFHWLQTGNGTCMWMLNLANCFFVLLDFFYYCLREVEMFIFHKSPFMLVICKKMIKSHHLICSQYPKLLQLYPYLLSKLKSINALQSSGVVWSAWCPFLRWLQSKKDLLLDRMKIFVHNWNSF